MAGTHPFRPESRKGPTPILPPVVEKPASEFRWITGGFVYRGKRLQKLNGYYVYSDTNTGRIWAFAPAVTRDAGGPASAPTTITSWPAPATRSNAGARTLAANSTSWTSSAAVSTNSSRPPPPRRRRRSHASSRKRASSPPPGSTGRRPASSPYTVNAPLWSDHAAKERFLAVPGDGQIGFEENTEPPSPGSAPGWRFPDGTVLVKTFSVDLERGNPRSRRRLETRLLHFRNDAGAREPGARHWHGYTYVWNDEQTDAELLDAAGADRLLKIKVGGRTVEQSYHFPSRAECTYCHTVHARFALGVNTAQMNHDHDYGGVVRLACSDPPEGSCRWTLTLLADELAVLGQVKKSSPETVRQALTKTTSNPGSSKPGACRRRRTRSSSGGWKT